MKRLNFPWIAAGIGIVLAFALLRGGAAEPAGAARLPTLTLLFMSEFGFLVTAAGAFVGIRNRQQTNGRGQLLPGIACSILAAGFAVLGLMVWREHMAV